MSHASESLALSHQIPLSNRRSNGYSRMSVQEFAPGSLHRMQPQRRTHHPETRHQDSRLLRLDDWYSFFGIGSCCCSGRGLLCHGRGAARGRISLISHLSLNPKLSTGTEGVWPSHEAGCHVGNGSCSTAGPAGLQVRRHLAVPWWAAGVLCRWPRWSTLR